MVHGDLTGRTLGDFILVGRLAEGAQGVVYRARQLSLGRDVVIKVMNVLDHHSPVAHERFLREVRLASLLDHPYAAHIYAFGIDPLDGLPWIAMELIHGVTLHKLIAAHGRMSLAQLVPIIAQVARVVHAAHQLGIVHRDLKPANIMVIELDGQQVIKLLDFGLAKGPPQLTSIELLGQADAAERALRAPDPAPRSGSSASRVTAADSDAADRVHPGPLTHPGSGIGSWAYMAPEQWHDAWSVGPAVDIYALGVIIYRALTGVDPFRGEHSGHYYRQHQDVPPPRLGGELASVDRVIQRALAKAPAERHATMLELADDLGAELRASEREQLRAAAQQWDARRRSPGLLWGREELPDLERWTRAPDQLTPLECSFVADSQRRVRRGVWLRRALGLLAVVLIVGGFAYRAVMRARIAEAQAAEAKLEQGRSALLHGESEALALLTAAYQHDHASSTAFMLARAVQPQLAELARLPAVKGRTWSASLSPDGSRIVTADDDAAQVWDAQTYHLVFRLAHGDTVYQASYSSDGMTIVTAGGDSTVRLWDARTGALVRAFKHAGKSLRYGAIAITDSLVAAIDISGEITHVWDASTGAALAELRNDALGYYSVAFSSDARFLATSSGNDVRVFDTRTWRNVQTIPGPGIHSLSWDPKGPRLLTGSILGGASLWTVPGGGRLRLREVGEPIDAVAFAPGGALVATASRDGSEQVWNAASGALQSQGNQLRDKIYSIEFDPTSKLIVAAGGGGAIAIAETSQAIGLAVLAGPHNAVLAAHFTPDSKRIMSASGSHASIWDAASQYHRWTKAGVSDDCGYITSLEPDRRFVAVGCQGQNTLVWDTDRDERIAELPQVTQVDGDFTSAYPAVSSSGDRAAIAHDHSVLVYELPSGRLLRTIEHGAAVNTVAFGNDRRDVVSGAVDGSVLVTWDNGAQLSIPASADLGGVDAVALLADGRVIAAHAHQRLRVYDSQSNVLVDLATRARVRTLRVSPDGRRLATIPSLLGKGAPPELWDLEHYQPLGALRTDDNDQARVYSARFVADRALLAAYSDGAVRRWDGTTGRLEQTYSGSARFIGDATLSSDRSMVIAAGADGILRYWDATSGQALWTMPTHRSPIISVRVDGDDVVTRGITGQISRWHVPDPADILAAVARHERYAIIAR